MSLWNSVGSTAILALVWTTICVLEDGGECKWMMSALDLEIGGRVSRQGVVMCSLGGRHGYVPLLAIS